MINTLRISSVLAAVLILSACTSFPTGPGMLVLPGTGKSFDQFRFDEADCRQYASSQIGGKTANEAATDSGVKSDSGRDCYWCRCRRINRWPQ